MYVIPQEYTSNDSTNVMPQETIVSMLAHYNNDLSSIESTLPDALKYQLYKELNRREQEANPTPVSDIPPAPPAGYPGL